MKIKELEVYNFKSYFGKQVIGPFSDHFTCIIGPNGNGKSNILDAMLFVFGFKSSKLRQDSLASLIHSSAFGQPDEAKVTVEFVETKTIESVEMSVNRQQESQKRSSSIKVSRTVRKNGYCFYQLNDKKINWNELRDFLMKKDIDLEKNLFIILQGEVQRLCQLSPEKLVEYIEYVAGSDRFLGKINELEKSYIDEGVKHERIKQRCGVARKIWNQQQLEAFELLEHIRLRIMLFEVGLLSAKKSKLITSQSQKKYQQLLEIQQHKMAKVEQKLSELKTTQQQLRLNLVQNQALVLDVQTQISKMNSQINVLETQDIKKLESEVQYSRRDIRQKEKQLQLIQKEKRELCKMTENEHQLKQESNQIEKKFAKILLSFNPENPDSPHQKANLPINLQSKEKETVFNDKYHKLKQIWKIKQQIQKAKASLDNQTKKNQSEKETKLRQVQENYRKLSQKYGSKGQKYTSSSQMAAKLKVRIRNLNQVEQQKEKQLAGATSNLDEIRRRLQECQSAKATLSNNQKIIHEIKTANRVNILLPGRTITTLRQHIMLPSQFMLVISAITPQLDFVVVSSHEEAKQVIQFLNARKIGRMSFILKDEVNRLTKDVITQSSKFLVPKGCQRIHDLGKVVDKQFEKIWFWSVGNTLIAETLDQAMKVAYGSHTPYRVITKNGEFIDISGAMTKVPIRAKNSEFEDKTLLEARLKVIQNKVEEQTRRLAQARRQRQKLMQELRDMSSHENEFSTLSELQLSLISLEEQLKSLTQQTVQLQLERSLNELTIRIQQKQLSSRLDSFKLSKGCDLTVQELIEMIDRQQNLLAKIKKISISEEILIKHEQRLKKNREEMYVINDRIMQQKHDIQKAMNLIKHKKGLIRELQNKRRSFKEQVESIQKKALLNDLTIKHLQGQIQRETHHIQPRISNNTQITKIASTYLVEREQNNKHQGIQLQNKTEKDEGKLGNRKTHNKNRVHNKQNRMQEVLQSEDRSRISQLPQIQIFDQRNLNKQNQHQDVDSSQTIFQTAAKRRGLSTEQQLQSIIQIRKQQHRLNALITRTNQHRKAVERIYQTQLNSLSSLFKLLFSKCKTGELDREKEQKAIHSQKKRKHNEATQINHQETSTSSGHNNDHNKQLKTNRVYNNNNNQHKVNPQYHQKNGQVLDNAKRSKTTDELINQNKRNIIVTFQDILLEYFNNKNLISLQKLNDFQIKTKTINQDQTNRANQQEGKSNENPSKYQNQQQSFRSPTKLTKAFPEPSRSESPKKGQIVQRQPIESNLTESLLLKNLSLPQSYRSLVSSSIGSIIYECFFNSLKIMSIGPSDEYFFTNFINQEEFNTIFSTQTQDDSKNQRMNLRSNKNHQQQEEDMLKHLDLQKIKFLKQFYEQKLSQLQKQSSSMFLKSGKKKNIQKGQYRMPSEMDCQGEDVQSSDEFPLIISKGDQMQSGSPSPSYFIDTQNPLDPHELQVLSDYIRQKRAFAQTQSALKTVEESLRLLYSELLSFRQQRTSCYLSTFNLINIQVNRIYNYLTKGNAEINMLNSMNPFEGLEFFVRPFNKSWKSVHLLSGGEKTLTSLALIFACEEIKKFPFYFMDQIDAALDYKNVSNLANYIKEKQKVQHIVISLRKNMYEQCQSLVCIYKIRDITHTLRVNVGDLYKNGRGSKVLCKNNQGHNTSLIVQSKQKQQELIQNERQGVVQETDEFPQRKCSKRQPNSNTHKNLANSQILTPQTMAEKGTTHNRKQRLSLPESAIPEQNQEPQSNDDGTHSCVSTQTVLSR